MSLIQQAPPPDHLLRGVTQRMDGELREYGYRRLSEINIRKRRLKAEKEAAMAHFKAREKDLDEESVSLEAASSAPLGKEVEIVYPCEGRVNLSTGQYDIYILEHDAEGREFPRFARSESLPEKYHYLLQEELPYAGRGKKDGKKDGKPKDDAPPTFPEDGKPKAADPKKEDPKPADPKKADKPKDDAKPADPKKADKPPPFPGDDKPS